MNERGIVDLRRHPISDLFCALALGAVVSSCGGADPISPSGTPASVALSSGDGQNGTVGTSLNEDFVVQVNDAAGTPVSNVVVTWAVTAGGGSIAPTSGLTNSSGLSQARLTLGPAEGTNTATATVAGVGSITFTATGTIGGGGGGGGGTPGNLVFRTIDAGSYHGCGITNTEVAYCWGLNLDGELGDGSIDSKLAPTAVAGGLRFRQVSGGKYHSCAVTLSGDGYCWGSNLVGQLGAISQVLSSTPLLNQKAITFASLSVGREHSCGLSLSGDAFCWGSNSGGQLGFFTENYSVDTAGFVFTALSFTTIASGGLHNCAITPQGTTHCWGFNDQGQLGNGTSTTLFPDTVSSKVTPVSGGFAFDTITAGYKHTCALTGGTAYCWGSNSYGQLGDGTNTNSSVPTPVSGGLTFVTLSAGFYHTCGITTTGAAYCWGRNTPNSLQESVGGQLGDGTTTDRNTPTLVTGGLSFKSISAGEVTTCGVTTTGVAYCWGDNEYGQLGTNSTTSFQVPTKLSNQP